MNIICAVLETWKIKKYIKEYEGKSLKKNIKKYRKRYRTINHLRLRKMEENKKIKSYKNIVIVSLMNELNLNSIQIL